LALVFGLEMVMLLIEWDEESKQVVFGQIVIMLTQHMLHLAVTNNQVLEEKPTK
jgi:hypothetical protein